MSLRIRLIAVAVLAVLTFTAANVFFVHRKREAAEAEAHRALDDTMDVIDRDNRQWAKSVEEIRNSKPSRNLLQSANDARWIEQESRLRHEETAAKRAAARLAYESQTGRPAPR